MRYKVSGWRNTIVFMSYVLCGAIALGVVLGVFIGTLMGTAQAIFRTFGL